MWLWTALSTPLRLGTVGQGHPCFEDGLCFILHANIGMAATMVDVVASPPGQSINTTILPRSFGDLVWGFKSPYTYIGTCGTRRIPMAYHCVTLPATSGAGRAPARYVLFYSFISF